MTALTDRLDQWAALAEKATPGPWAATFGPWEPSCVWASDDDAEPLAVLGGYGDSWLDDGPRPLLERGGRKRAQERFARAWETALPEGTRTVRDDGPDGVYAILGVQLPDEQATP